MTVAVIARGSGDFDRRCPRCSKRITPDPNTLVRRCDHCGYGEAFAVDRKPAVTRSSAKDLVARYRSLVASGEPVPVSRRYTGWDGPAVNL